jgi:hypothetical protein
MKLSLKSLLCSLFLFSVFGGLLGCDIDEHRHWRHHGYYDDARPYSGWGRSGDWRERNDYRAWRYRHDRSGDD